VRFEKLQFTTDVTLDHNVFIDCEISNRRGEIAGALSSGRPLC